jgi:hypothetical protein
VQPQKVSAGLLTGETTITISLSTKQDAQQKRLNVTMTGPCNNDNSDTSSIISETSTTEYDQEPCSTFHHKAIQLMLNLSPGYQTEDVLVSQINGGGYNRILGITLQKAKPKLPWYSLANLRSIMQPCLTGRKLTRSLDRPKHFILRIPRSPTLALPYQVTTLAYLGHRIAHPVPKVVVYDATADNALGQAYMLQERLPGQPLSDLWETLNQAQKMSVVRQIARILLDIGKVKNECPGILSLRNTLFDIKRDLVRVEPVSVPLSQLTSSTTLSSSQTTREFLLDLCARQRAHAKADGLLLDKFWTRVVSMIETLHALGFIPDTSSFHFSHEDLYARNIFASVTSRKEVEVTAILDWDHALFAPKFLSTRAPFWLWSGEDIDQDDERNVFVEPEDPGMVELKRCFEEVVGEAFCKDAYMRELVLARGVWTVLLVGRTCGEDVNIVEEVLDEFERLHPGDV